MSENYRSRIHEKLKRGVEERGYSLAERLSNSEGASGSVAFKGEKDGKKVVLKVGSYGFLDSFEVDNVDKLSDFRRREREVLQLAGNHPNIPAFVESYTIEGDEFYPQDIHVLAMEYKDVPSIAQRIMKGERASDKEAQIVLRDGLLALNHLHTGLPYQVLHRDVKTSNVLLNHEKAYLIDFDIVKQGEDDATSATSIRNPYYPEDSMGGHQNQSHDLVALGNVAVASIAGKEINTIRTEQELYGLDPINVDGLLVSDIYKQFIRKLISGRKERFQTAREALNDLERRIGTSLPVVVRPVETSQSLPIRFSELTNSNKPEILRSLYDGVVHLKYKGESPRFIGTEKENLYETIKDIRDYNLLTGGGDSILSENLLSYLEYVSKDHPILQDVVSGEKTFESLVKRGGSILDEDLYKMAGVDINGSKIMGTGLAAGILAGAGTVIHSGQGGEDLIVKFLTAAIGGALLGGAIGVIAATPFQIMYERKKISSRFQELDGLFKRARSQGLEGKVDDVELSNEEKDKIDLFIKGPYYDTEAVWGGASLLAAGLSVVGVPLLDNPYILATSVGILGTAFGSLIGRESGLLKKYLTNRALKKKRIANGLPAKPEKKKRISRYYVMGGRSHAYLNVVDRILEENGFEERFSLFGHKFVKGDLEVKYNSSFGSTKLTFKADEERLEEFNTSGNPLSLTDLGNRLKNLKFENRNEEGSRPSLKD